MIPIGLMAIGSIISLISIIDFIIVLKSPLTVKRKNILGQLELNDEGTVKKTRKRDRVILGSWDLFFATVGSFVVLLGWSLGYNQKDGVFWFIPFISGDYKSSEKWDRLSEDGNFISNNGTEYPYYLLISGNTYEFSGEVCEDLEDVKNKLSKIKRENTVIIIDSYAVSSRIKDAEKLLTEMGIKYEMEEV